MAPVAGSGLIAPKAHVVKAAALTSDQLMNSYYSLPLVGIGNARNSLVVKSTKQTPYLTANSGETVSDLSREKIRDIISNYGHVIKYDGMAIYPTFEDGFPDYKSRLASKDELHNGQNYVSILSFTVSDLPHSKGGYIYLSAYKEEGDWTDGEVSWYKGGSLSNTHPIIAVPVYVSAASSKQTATVTNSNKTKVTKKSSSHKVNFRGYVKARKNHKVRTYTSTGKFSRHYVYGHHTYRFNEEKSVHSHGTCYKLYGKSQWVPGKYLIKR